MKPYGPHSTDEEKQHRRDDTPCLTADRRLEPNLPATDTASRCSATSWVCQAAGRCGVLGKVDQEFSIGCSSEDPASFLGLLSLPSHLNRVGLDKGTESTLLLLGLAG